MFVPLWFRNTLIDFHQTWQTNSLPKKDDRVFKGGRLKERSGIYWTVSIFRALWELFDRWISWWSKIMTSSCWKTVFNLSKMLQYSPILIVSEPGWHLVTENQHPSPFWNTRWQLQASEKFLCNFLFFFSRLGIYFQGFLLLFVDPFIFFNATSHCLFDPFMYF